MYDGIENAGLGVHDPEALTWINLVEGSPFGDAVNEKPDGIGWGNTTDLVLPMWTDNACMNMPYYVANRKYVCFGVEAPAEAVQSIACTEVIGNLVEATEDMIRSSFNIPVLMQCGVAFTYESYNSTLTFLTGIQNSLWPTGKYQPWISFSNRTLRVMSPFEKRTYHALYNNGNPAIMLNGEDTVYTSGRSTGTTINIPRKYALLVGDHSVQEINCIRLYDRELSHEERKHNYLIDKARFGV